MKKRLRDPKVRTRVRNDEEGERMTVIVIAHFVAALLALPLVRSLGRRAFYPLALVPAASAVWLGMHKPSGGEPRVELTPWIPTLDIELIFRLDVLSWVLAMMATAIGACVLMYCAQYFKDTEPALGRFAAVLTAFAGAMVGLVLSDDVMMMFVFWELTTIFSYLLIGHYIDKQASRRAALNAMITTVFGGLAMMVGLLMLGVRADSLRFSVIMADPMWAEGGAYVITATVLVLLGAFSKSAQLPTHFWLPGAMAAPTPVSAYLHAAAMVKAGIYLVLRIAPGLQYLESMAIFAAVVGAATMLVGGWRALRQTDIKLLLAYGTVSQLGFLIAVSGLATRNAMMAAMAMMLAHSLFKAPLFMVVGIIDKKFGTRDLRVLSNVWKVAPVVAAIGTLSALSMAAVPPMYGFIAKEALYSALWYEGGWRRILLIALVVGSILTVAYSWRFVKGAFGPSAGAPDVAKASIPVLYWMPPAAITAFSLLLIVGAHPLEELLRGYADTFEQVGKANHLAVIPEIGIPLLLSGVTLGAGAVLIVFARRVERFQRAVSPQTIRDGALMEWLDAERMFRRTLRTTDALAVAITPYFQRGSLPFTLGTAFVVLIVAVAYPIFRLDIRNNLLLFHNPAELLLLALAIAATIGAVRSRRRLRAVLLVSLSGYISALYFSFWGAVDVATTQLLVETVVTVVMVLVLRRLPRQIGRA